MLTSPLPAYLWFGLGLDVDVVVNHLQGWAGVGGGVGCWRPLYLPSFGLGGGWMLML